MDFFSSEFLYHLFILPVRMPDCAWRWGTLGERKIIPDKGGNIKPHSRSFKVIKSVIVGDLLYTYLTYFRIQHLFPGIFASIRYRTLFYFQFVALAISSFLLLVTLIHHLYQCECSLCARACMRVCVHVCARMYVNSVNFWTARWCSGLTGKVEIYLDSYSCSCYSLLAECERLYNDTPFVKKFHQNAIPKYLHVQCF